MLVCSVAMVQEKRLMNRQTESPESLRRRLHTAREEMEYGEQCSVGPYSF